MSRQLVAAALARLHFAAGFGDYVKTLESGYNDAVMKAITGKTRIERDDGAAEARVYKDILDQIKRDSPK